jgi:S1-C subfamily serine protease
LTSSKAFAIDGHGQPLNFLHDKNGYAPMSAIFEFLLETLRNGRAALADHCTPRWHFESAFPAVGALVIALAGTMGAPAESTLAVRDSLVFIISGSASHEIGTGFVVESDHDGSWILTDSHVLGVPTQVTVFASNNLADEVTPSQPVTMAPDADLALIRIKTQLPALRLINDDAGIFHLGSTSTAIDVWGYPYAAYKVWVASQTLEPSARSGTIVQKTDGKLEFSATTEHGISGGPVIEAVSNLVVGVAQTFESNGKITSTGAIPIRAIKKFLASTAVHATYEDYSTPADLSHASGANRFAYVVAPRDRSTWNGKRIESADNDLVWKLRPILGVVPIDYSGALGDACSVSNAVAIVMPSFTFKETHQTVTDLTPPGLSPMQYVQQSATFSGEIRLELRNCDGQLIASFNQPFSQLLKALLQLGPAEDKAVMQQDAMLADSVRQFVAANSLPFTNLKVFGFFLTNDEKIFGFAYRVASSGMQVTAVDSSGPAAVAGLHSGEFIVAIGTTKTLGLSDNELSALINGQSFLDLTIRRTDGSMASLNLLPRDLRWLISSRSGQVR